MTAGSTARIEVADGWTLAGTSSALDRPGSFVTCDSGYTPMIVVRGQDGVLRAFVNMCRHRGMALLQGCGEVGKSITCPYHAWRFDTTGALRVIPQRAAQFPDVDPADWNLLPGTVAEVGGLAFASSNPDAQPLPLLLAAVWTPQDEAAAAETGTAGTFDLRAANAANETATPLGLIVEVRDQALVAIAVAPRPDGCAVRVGIGSIDESRLPALLVTVRGQVTAQLDELGEPPILEPATIREGIPA